MPNKQIKALLDTVEDFLIKQGEPAQDGGCCFYKTPEGLKCGVGCLIPEELYSEDYEYRSVNTEDLSPVVSYIASAYELPENTTLKVLYDIQKFHDKAALSPEGFSAEHLKEGFRTLRDKYLKSQ